MVNCMLWSFYFSGRVEEDEKRKEEREKDRETRGRENQSGCDKHSTEDTRKTGINPDSHRNRIS